MKYSGFANNMIYSLANFTCSVYHKISLKTDIQEFKMQ